MVPNGWLHKQIGEIASIQVGRDLVEDKYSEISTTEYKYPVYSNTVENKGLYGFYNFPEYSGNAITIVGRGVGLGKAFARSPGESFGAIGRLLVLTPKNNSFDVIFFANYINFALRIHNESGGIPQLPGASLSKYFVMLPPLAEQQKIAQILSTWDKAIAVTEQLLANSQQQKKALMQQLLTGKKRLLDENGVRFEGEWVEFLLEDLEEIGWIELNRGKVISKSDISNFPGDYPIYSSSIKNKGLMGTYGMYMFDEELISWSVDGGGNFFYRPKHKFSVTNVSGYMRLDIKKLNYQFIASQLELLHTKLQFDYQSKAHPSVIRKLYKLAICSLEEQQKIANILSAADQEIEALQRKLDGLQQEKKALMQQLLTGKRRVKVAA